MGDVQPPDTSLGGPAAWCPPGCEWGAWDRKGTELPYSHPLQLAAWAGREPRPSWGAHPGPGSDVPPRGTKPIREQCLTELFTGLH